MFGNTLRTRVLLAFSALSFTPLLIIGLYTYLLARQAVLEQARDHITSTARARHASIESWLAERRQDIFALAHLPILIQRVEGIDLERDADTRLLEGLLESTRAAGQPYESLTVYDSSWSVLARVRERNHTEEEFLTGSFKTGVENAQDVYFDAAHLHERGQVGSHFGLVIRTDGDKAVGYLVANLNLSKSLTPLMTDRSGLGDSGKAYIIGDDLQVLSEPFPSGERVAFDRQANPVHLECRAEQGRDVRQYRDFFGNMVLGTSMMLPLQGWAVVVEIDSKEVMKWERLLLTRVAVTFLIAIVAIILVSLWLSTVLGRPLASLAAVAHRIISGNTEERLGDMGTREANEVRLAVNRMLDELKNKETEIVRTATLATVGELTSRIAHEMRNPISSIRVNLQTICQASIPDSDCQELAEIAIGQAERLEEMLNEMLQYGKPLQLSPEEITFGELVEKSISSTGGLAEGRGVRIVVKDELGTQKLRVDCEHLTRAITNLLQNAIEATPSGTDVLIRACESEHRDGQFEIAVCDRGPGIPRECRERVFAPFFTTKSRGIGLGLANVKRIVEQHGGAVRADERPEGGAIFSIRLRQSENGGSGCLPS
jgi:signal transduction histidine kinase